MSSFFQSIHNFFVGHTDSGHAAVGAESVHVPVTSEEESATGRLSDAAAPEGQEFYVYNGPTVSTVGELADVLNQASEETFRHHINGSDNDFADWVRNVFDDDAAAAVIESARNPSEVVYILDTLST